MPHVMYFFEHPAAHHAALPEPAGVTRRCPSSAGGSRRPTCTVGRLGSLREINRIVAGTPEKVADVIATRGVEEAKTTRSNLNIAVGDMPNWKVVKSTTLFAEEVIPRLRSRKVVMDDAETIERIELDVNGTTSVVLASATRCRRRSCTSTERACSTAPSPRRRGRRTSAC